MCSCSIAETFSQGTPYYNIYKGEVEVKLMNEMGYDACTIGNHEFDFGLENMARLFKMAAFPSYVPTTIWRIPR